MKFLQSELFAAILGSTIFALTTAFLTTKELTSTPSLESAAGSSTQANIKGPSWAFFNTELDQIIGELKAERDTVPAKERQLNELGTRLQAERAEPDDALKNIKI